jgi:hypothetical protein
MKRHNFRAGDRVVVRTPDEILSTLDGDGTLQGLPFMPEMLDLCGKEFHVERRAEKTCVDVPPPVYPNRRFAADDVVFLDGPRCDGRSHDGCKRGCKIFWKEDWLRPAESVGVSTQASTTGLSELLLRLKTKSDETHYFCQSTQLHKATTAFSGNKKLWRLRIIYREIRNGDRSVPEVLKLLALWSSHRLLRAVHGDQWLRGPHERAPSESLGLKPGEMVRVKSRAELEATLDRRRSNRGLRISTEATRYCGGRAEVRDRVDRIIDERTGTMREPQDTVSLRNMSSRLKTLGALDCVCAGETGDCPRGELMYFREIWLERVHS